MALPSQPTGDCSKVGGGDRDYNDLVVGLDFTSASGHRWLAQAADLLGWPGVKWRRKAALRRHG
jgi:hypothetical protein